MAEDKGVNKFNSFADVISGESSDEASVRRPRPSEGEERDVIAFVADDSNGQLRARQTRGGRKEGREWSEGGKKK